MRLRLAVSACLLLAACVGGNGPQSPAPERPNNERPGTGGRAPANDPDEGSSPAGAGGSASGGSPGGAGGGSGGTAGGAESAGAAGTGGVTAGTGGDGPSATGGSPGGDAAGDDAAPAGPPSACPAGRALAWRLDLTDPNWNGGAKGVEAALTKLGAMPMYGQDHASVIKDPEHGDTLKVVYPVGSGSSSCVEQKACSSGGGFVFRAPLPDGNNIKSALLSYWVKFDTGFDWVKGGKLPGLCGGACPTGGREVDPDRFSVRYMWRGGPAAEIYGYLTNPPNPGYGLDLGVGAWRWQADGKWHQIQLELVLNSGNAKDGTLRVWYDVPTTAKPTFEQKNVTYYDRVKHPDLGIDKLIFSTFHGGQDASWSPRKESVAYFADFQLCR